MPGEAIEEEARERLGIGERTLATNAYRTWWAAGAILVALLVTDLFVLIGWAMPLDNPLGWFSLSLLTIVFLALTVMLRPGRTA